MTVENKPDGIRDLEAYFGKNNKCPLLFSALFHYVHITMTSKMFFLCLIASSVLTIKHNLQPTVCNSIQLQPRRTSPWRDRTSRRDGCTVAGRKLPPIILNLMNLTAGRTNDESLQQRMKQDMK